MTDQQTKLFLNSWAKGVIQIGNDFVAEKDYMETALDFLSTHYAFDEEPVLFKPTFTKEVVFRNTKEAALSYFVKGYIEEDNGFALKPWEDISLEELKESKLNGLKAVMGTLKFKPAQSNDTTVVAFTFLLKEVGGKLKIKVHHSSPI